MKKWQIYGHSGILLTIVEAVTAYGALTKYANNNSYDTWEQWNNYLGLSYNYTILDGTDKIVLGDN